MNGKGKQSYCNNTEQNKNDYAVRNLRCLLHGSTYISKVLQSVLIFDQNKNEFLYLYTLKKRLFIELLKQIRVISKASE